MKTRGNSTGEAYVCFPTMKQLQLYPIHVFHSPSLGCVWMRVCVGVWVYVHVRVCLCVKYIIKDALETYLHFIAQCAAI